MQHEIIYRPSYSLLKVKLSKGEVISAETGAMVSMLSSIEIETKMKAMLVHAGLRYIASYTSADLSIPAKARQPDVEPNIVVAKCQ